MFSGPPGLTKSVLDGISTPLDFFSVLKEKGFLDVNNIVVLHALLVFSGRGGLYQKMTRFAEQQRNVCYLKKPDPSPGQYRSLLKRATCLSILLHKPRFVWLT